MGVVLALSLVRARVRIAVLAVGFGLFELVVALSYASIDQNAIRSLVESLPPALKAFSGAADVASPAGYVGAAYIHPVPLTIQGALVISMASAAARDTETGAAELLLSRPLQPWRWLLAQTAAVAIALTAVATGGYLGGLAGITIVGDLSEVSGANLLVASAGGALLFAAIAGITLLAAILTRGGARAVGWSAGIVVVSYALNYLAQVWTIAEPIGPLSVFHHYDPGVITGTGSMDAGSVLALALTAVVTAVIAHVLVQRRELAGT